MQSITMSIIKAIKFEEEIDKIIEGYVSISITKKNPNISQALNAGNHLGVNPNCFFM